jgi:universal stress protein E
MKAYQNIIVGVDFSPASLSAIRTAVRLAAPQGTPVTAVHVADPKLVGVMKEAHHADDHEVTKHISESVHAFLASSNAGTQLVKVELVVGHAFLSLASACKRHKADLLVLGTRGTEHGPNQIGAAAAKCLRKIPADVLLVREGANLPFTHISACVDFSDSSAKAVRAAGAFAAHDHAMLDCVFIYQSALALAMDYGGFMPGLPVTNDETPEYWKRDLDGFVRPLLSKVPSLPWRTKVVESVNIRDGIRLHVAESKTDLVVLGTQGKSNLQTLLMGTTAERIVNHAHCSVLVVKPEGFVSPIENYTVSNLAQADERSQQAAHEHQSCACSTKGACKSASPAAIAPERRYEEEAVAPC